MVIEGVQKERSKPPPGPVGGCQQAARQDLALHKALDDIARRRLVETEFAPDMAQEGLVVAAQQVVEGAFTGLLFRQRSQIDQGPVRGRKDTAHRGLCAVAHKLEIQMQETSFASVNQGEKPWTD